MRKISPLLITRPDCSRVFSAYLKKFPNNGEAADILRKALMLDPIYDATAANYIDALDVCEPETCGAVYRKAVETAGRRSEEKSILLPISSLTFKGRRCDPKLALRIIRKQNDSRVRGFLIHRLFGDAPNASFKIFGCKSLLEKEVSGKDGDLSRLCAWLLLSNWPTWRPSRRANESVKLLALALGMRKRAPRQTSILATFFKEKMGIKLPISWRKALGKDLSNGERRCLRLQKLEVGDPSARVMILDTFNEVLMQAFSSKHPSLAAAYLKACGKKPNPDFGDWINRDLLEKILPKGISWFRDVHNARVTADLAHAKSRSGRKKGTPTRPVAFRKAEAFMKKARFVWAELIREWSKIL